MQVEFASILIILQALSFWMWIGGAEMTMI
jgi:hypothetical protein